MQLDLKNLAPDALVDLLIKNTRYFMLLCNTEADMDQRRVAEKYIDDIITEIKSRDGYTAFNSTLSSSGLSLSSLPKAP